MTTTGEPFAEVPRREPQPLAPGLYLVGTPIGNLEDITLRALRVLRDADRIACEDTRQTQKLLNHFSIATPTVSYHLHNEDARAAELIEAMRTGGRIALVSDAGTPGIADPGTALVVAAIAAGVTVYPVPGANAALSAITASGLSAERFTFRGFLPSRPGERRTALEVLRAELTAVPGTTQVLYESPHRVLDTLRDIAEVFGADHRVVAARELTKLHEEFLRGSAGSVLTELETRNSIRGEFVLLLNGELPVAQACSVEPLASAVRALMNAESLDEKEAIKRVARERGIGKSDAYREWQRTRGR